MVVGDVEPQARLERLDLRAARRWLVTARAELGARRQEIDALNVFPVADSDTGTNLFVTLDAAVDAVREQTGSAGPHDRAPDLRHAAAALARAAMLTARGNSGVIFSQLLRGVSEVLAEGVFEDASDGVAGGGPSATGMDAASLARSLRRAADLAHAGVTRPVEGTILTVAAAAATGAERGLAAGGDLHTVTAEAVTAARAALALTTAQLPALRAAGVVDAGGAGYVVLLEALERVLSGAATPVGWHRALPVSPDAVRLATPPGALPVTRPGGARWSSSEAAGLLPDGPAYEVMYLLSDSSEDAVRRLRGALDDLGSSVIVVGGPDIWNVHAHVDDVGAALEAGVQAGRPHRIVVTHLATTPRPPGPGPVAVVACAVGPGLEQVFRASGAGVVAGRPGRGASTGQILDAVRATGAATVLVLPNDDDSMLAAEAAATVAGDAGIAVHVVRSRAAVQGIAALAVFDPSAGSADNLLAMTSAVAATRHGGVAVASRDGLTSAGWCHPGDVLGMVDGDVVTIGSDVALVGGDVAQRLLGSGGELLTIVTGAGAAPELGVAVGAVARTRRRDVEVSVIEGGQGDCPLLLGVE